MKTERYLWIALSIGISVWGAMRGGERPAPDHARDSPRESHGIGPRRAAERINESSASRREKETSVKTGGVDSRMTRALGTTDPVERMGLWLNLLSACDESQIKRVEEAWNERKTTGIALPAEEALLNYRLGQLGGGEQLEAHHGTPPDFEKLDMLRSRFEGWLNADPAGATRWLDNLPEGKFRDQMALTSIASSVRDQPEAAVHAVAALPEHLRRKAGEAAGNRLRETGTIEEGSAVLSMLESGSADESYLNGIFDVLVRDGKNDGEGSNAAVLENHLTRPYVSMETLAKVSAEKGRSDPQAALDWAVELEEKRTDLPQGSLLTASVRKMDPEDLEKAEQWASERPGWPGTADMLMSVQARKRLLEDQGNDANEYDKDD